MNSLHAHLVAGRAHASLPFHPECAACRAERLAGALPDHALLPRSVTAGICAGVLSVSTVLATAGPLAAPAGADEVSAGAVAKPGDDADDPKDDDDGQEEEVDASGAEEVTVITDSTPPAPPPAAGPAPVAQGGQAPAEPAPADAASGTQPAPAQAPAPVQAAPAPPAPSQEESREGDDTGEDESRKPDDAPKPDHAPKRASVAPQPAVPAPEPAAVAPRPVAAAPKGGESHVVQPGESLWSIARAALGEGASPAQIARYVDRLWTLNADRIGTGDPSLVHVGERLALPLER